MIKIKKQFAYKKELQMAKKKKISNNFRGINNPRRFWDEGKEKEYIQ